MNDEQGKKAEGKEKYNHLKQFANCKTCRWKGDICCCFESECDGKRKYEMLIRSKEYFGYTNPLWYKIYFDYPLYVNFRTTKYASQWQRYAKSLRRRGKQRKCVKVRILIEELKNGK